MARQPAPSGCAPRRFPVLETNRSEDLIGLLDRGAWVLDGARVPDDLPRRCDLDAVYRHGIQRLINERGLGGSVTSTGYQPVADVPRLLAAADVAGVRLHARHDHEAQHAADGVGPRTAGCGDGRLSSRPVAQRRLHGHAHATPRSRRAERGDRPGTRLSVARGPPGPRWQGTGRASQLGQQHGGPPQADCPAPPRVGTPTRGRVVTLTGGQEAPGRRPRASAPSCSRTNPDRSLFRDGLVLQPDFVISLVRG